MFKIEHTSNSIKFLKKSDNTLKERIIKKIDFLKVEPVSHDSKKLVGETRCFRV